MSSETHASEPPRTCCPVLQGFHVSSNKSKYEESLDREGGGAYEEPYHNDDVFSKNWKPPKFNKNHPSYGRPLKGSLTEKRGIAAGNHIAKEIIYLCEIISEYGQKNPDGTVTITFGKLFDLYVYISDKVVGMLLRARKHKIVSFEGEMLYQRQDEKVPITLLRPLDEVRQLYASSNDPSRCVTTSMQ